MRFAVVLFDIDESTIAPGSAAAIEALGSGGAPVASPGTSAGPSPATSPGASGGTTGEPVPAATERPTTRDELWVPIVLIVLGVLCAEWALYHRDALVRIRRSLATRLRRDASGVT